MNDHGDAHREPERQTVAVTPPTIDTEMMRDFLKARADGWTSLEWADDVDSRGRPMGRLTGVRVSALEAAAYARGALDMRTRAAAVALVSDVAAVAAEIEALDVEAPQ